MPAELDTCRDKGPKHFYMPYTLSQEAIEGHNAVNLGLHQEKGRRLSWVELP